MRILDYLGASDSLYGEREGIFERHVWILRRVGKLRACYPPAS